MAVGAQLCVYMLLQANKIPETLLQNKISTISPGNGQRTSHKNSCENKICFWILPERKNNKWRENEELYFYSNIPSGTKTVSKAMKVVDVQHIGPIICFTGCFLTCRK